MPYGTMELMNGGGAAYIFEAQRVVGSGTVAFNFRISTTYGYASEADWDDVMQEVMDYFAANFINVVGRKQHPGSGDAGAQATITPTP